MRYFLAVAGAGSLSGAAERVFVAQPALSQQMRQLEQELGQVLFLRHPRGVRLTETGRRFQARALAVLRQVDAIRDELASSDEAPAGEVVVGMAMAANIGFSVASYEAVRRRYPGIRLHLVESMSGFLPEWIERGSIDLALTYDAPRSAHYQVDVLPRESLYLAAPHGLAQQLGSEPALQDLARIPLILPGFPHALRVLIDRTLQAHGLQANAIAQVDSTYSIKKLLHVEQAGSVLPLHAFREDVARGELVALPIAAPGISRQLCLLTGIARQTDPAVVAVRASIGEVVRAACL